MKKVDEKVISTEYVDKLSDNYYRMNALKDLMKDNAQDVILDKYTEIYRKYNETWTEILKKYFDGKYMEGNFNWACDFQTRNVTITEG